MSRAPSQRLGRAFWSRPAACGVVAVFAAFGLARIDRAIGDGGSTFLFPGPPEGARSFLGAVITAMISFTGLVFSITVVVLVLTSGQFSPRVLRQFLRDRTIQWSLGLFVAAFVYAIFTLREVLGTNGSPDSFVPRIALTGSFLLVLAAVAQFIRYIHHIVNVIQVTSILDRIAIESRQLVDRRHRVDPPTPPPAADRSGPQRTLAAPRTGMVVYVDEDAVVSRAAADGVTVVLAVRVGDFVPRGAPLMTVHGPGETVDAEGYTGAVAQGIERSMDQDVAFGFRQLIDIVVKALSPSINDPTTASQGIDALHDLLRRLVSRPWCPIRRTDRAGVVRLEVPDWTVAELMELTVAEITHFGASSTQIPSRLRRMLDDLGDAALPEHVDAVGVGRRLLPAATSSAA